MTKMEVGQSYHHEFWTIGLNVHGADCRLPKHATVAASQSATSRGDQRLASHREAATVENILSARGHETVPATIAAAFTEIHNGRAMVLGWGGGGRRRISGSVQTICLRTLSRSASARAGGPV